MGNSRKRRRNADYWIEYFPFEENFSTENKKSLKWINSNTYSYLRPIFRLPISVEVLFKIRKRFFKILCFFIIFSNFSNFEISWFLAKNLKIEVEKTFSRNDAIWYVLYKKFAHMQFWKKSRFFPEKPCYFQMKNTRISCVSEILLSLSHSTVNLQQFAEKKIHAQ